MTLTEIISGPAGLGMKALASRLMLFPETTASEVFETFIVALSDCSMPCDGVEYDYILAQIKDKYGSNLYEKIRLKLFSYREDDVIFSYGAVEDYREYCRYDTFWGRQIGGYLWSLSCDKDFRNTLCFPIEVCISRMSDNELQLSESKLRTIDWEDLSSDDYKICADIRRLILYERTKRYEKDI